MKVSDLQQHLADLGRLLEATGAKSVAGDLAAIRDGLSPFRDLPLKGFADFLVRADTYRKGGEVPVNPPKGTGPGRRVGGKGEPKPSPPNVETLAQEVRELYGRAADPSVTGDWIEAVMGRLSGLTQKGLVAVAAAIDLKGMTSKKKDDIVAAIRQRILSRKGSSQRVGLADRPTSPSPAPGPFSPREVVGAGQTGPGDAGTTS